MRISDWSSDVCSSDLRPCGCGPARLEIGARFGAHVPPGVIDHELAQSFLAHLNDRANQVLLSQRIALIDGDGAPVQQSRYGHPRDGALQQDREQPLATSPSAAGARRTGGWLVPGLQPPG